MKWTWNSESKNKILVSVFRLFFGCFDLFGIIRFLLSPSLSLTLFCWMNSMSVHITITITITSTFFIHFFVPLIFALLVWLTENFFLLLYSACLRFYQNEAKEYIQYPVSSVYTEPMVMDGKEEEAKINGITYHNVHRQSMYSMYVPFGVRIVKVTTKKWYQ